MGNHNPADGLRLACSFLTRLPVGGGSGDLHRAFWAFPLVGGGIGLAGGAVYAAGVLIGLPLMGAVFLALIAMAVLTGGLHEDGLADMADGFAGADPTAKLAIMRDSRIGTYGVLALVLVIGLKVTSLTHIGARGSASMAVVAALVAAGALSRAAVLVLPLCAKPARADGLGARMPSPHATQLIVPLAVAGALTILALLRFGWAPILWAAMAAAVGVAGVGWLAVRQIGGYTGDVLGAAQQVSETAILAALATTMVGVRP